jgi:hypothetical protein
MRKLLLIATTVILHHWLTGPLGEYVATSRLLVLQHSVCQLVASLILIEYLPMSGVCDDRAPHGRQARHILEVPRVPRRGINIF